MIPAIDELCHFLEYMDNRSIELLLSILQQLPDKSHVKIKDFAVAVGKVYKKDQEVSCEVCNRTVPSVYHAIEQGWSPESWYADGEPGPAPVCPDCEFKYFSSRPYGELEVLPPGEWIC